jgi:branched-chain amino acid transport system permease protein
VLQYVVAGLVFGSLYAITASGLLVTYLSAGVLNFSFGATAYFVARLFYFLHTTHEWPIWLAVVVSVFVAAPAIGLLLYALVFRLLRLASTLIKIVATVGVAVTIPPIANIWFGDKPILLAPGVAPRPLKVFRLFDVPVTMDQVVVYGCVVLLLVIGTGVLRYTDIGLRVRAMVDSPAMTSVSGTNPERVAAGVWAASTFLAGLIGIVSAPIIGLDPASYTLLMIAAFAAVIAARLHSLPVAVVVGLAMGIAGSVVQYYLPPSSSLTQAAIPSIPFVVTALFLFGNVFRRGHSDEVDHVGGALDRAIIPQRETTTGFVAGRPVRWVWSLAALAGVAILPLFLTKFWVSQVAAGVAFGIVFLSFTLVIGEGGMVWLCQVTFAGVGALATAQLATNHGWPLGLAILGGALIAVPLGVVIGLLSIRLGDLYLALVTLTFGLLMERLVFTRETFTNRGNGVAIHRPDLIRTDTALTYLALAVFCVVALLVVNVRRSTTGMALSAVRASPTAARTLGISVLQMKVLVAGLGALAAAIGGALLGVQAGLAVPSQYSTIQGFVFLAVLVSLGIRSTVAALLAGLAFTVSPALAEIYLPHWFAQLPPILFGLGAILVAKYPEGSLTENVRQVRTLRLRLRAWRQRGPAPVAPDIVRSAES